MVVVHYENVLASRHEWYNLDIAEMKLIVGGRAVKGRFGKAQELILQEVGWKLEERKFSCRASLKAMKKRFAKSSHFLYEPMVTIWSDVCDNAQT